MRHCRCVSSKSSNSSEQNFINKKLTNMQHFVVLHSRDKLSGANKTTRFRLQLPETMKQMCVHRVDSHHVAINSCSSRCVAIEHTVCRIILHDAGCILQRYQQCWFRTLLQVGSKPSWTLTESSDSLGTAVVLCQALWLYSTNKDVICFLKECSLTVFHSFSLCALLSSLKRLRSSPSSFGQ